MKPLYKQKYPHLFSPMPVGRKGQVVYKNRILVPPVCSMGYGTDAHHRISEDGIRFYTPWAQGGFAGLTVPVEIPLNGGHRGTMSLRDDLDGFAYMHNLQRPVHMYGVVTLCEIYHAGCCILPDSGYPIISASSFIYNGHQVKEMDDKDMEDVLKLYVDTAVLAVRAGFDGICLHYGHGWLINNFLSPLSNHRTDNYGGSVENRTRFPKMILKAIREAIGYYPIIELRMNGSDKMEGGITPEDAVQQALIFEEYVDMIHVSCGTRLDATSRPKMHPTCFVPDAHNADASELFKKSGLKIPIGVVGAISDAALAERLIAEGKCDYILAARQSVADPFWPNKVREGREEDIRPCIRCDYCLDGGRRSSHTTEVNISNTSTFDVHCSVNPHYRQGRHKLDALLPTTPKRVAVVGGGIAGLQAAMTAADRGHQVTLFEKSARLGGQTATYADHIPFKRRIRALREYLITQVKKRGVNILLNTRADRALLEEADYDAVIVAVGGKPRVPVIPGLKEHGAVMAWDVFGKESSLKEPVVVVGGGAVGCETAIHLAMAGKKNLTIVEMTPWIASTSEITERMSIEEQIRLHGIETLTECLCVAITEHGMRVRKKNGEEREIEAGSVVISAGTVEEREERDSFEDVAFDVLNIGDCAKVGTIRTAIESGWDAAARI